MNADKLGKLVHEDLRCVVYPRSLGQPVKNKEEWLKEAAGMIGFATGFEVGRTPLLCFPTAKSALQTNIHSIIEAKERVVLHVCIPIIFG